MSAIGQNGPTTGTIKDIVNRISATLAPWFPDLPSAPVLNSILTSQADQFAFVYQYLQFAAKQTRIKTATGGWLDLIAWDYFGARFLRRINETDASFASRILKELLRPRQTRAAITQLIVDLVGTPPQIQEAWNPQDWGAYGVAASGCGYGLSIGYGSLQYPNQVFVTTLTVPGSGIPNVAGYGGSIAGYGKVGSRSVYSDISQIAGTLTNAELYADISQVIAAGTIAWVSIVGAFKPAPVTVLASVVPPFTHFGRTAAHAEIIASWVPPDPSPMIGGLQPLIPIKLPPVIMAVRVDNPQPNRNALDNSGEIIGTWQRWPDDPSFFVFEGRQQPFEPRKLLPAFLAVPVNNPPSYAEVTVNAAAAVSRWQQWPDDPAFFVFAGRQQPFEAARLNPSFLAVPVNNPPPHAEQAAINAAIAAAAWLPADPTPFTRQPYEPGRLIAATVNANAPPQAAEQTAITAQVVGQAWTPADPAPHLPNSRWGA